MLSRSEFLVALGSSVLGMDVEEAEPRFSLACIDVPVRDVLGMIGSFTGKPWQMNDSIGGFLTIKTHDLTFKATLTEINRKLSSEIHWGNDKDGVLNFTGSYVHDAREKPVTLKKFARYAGFGSCASIKQAILEISPTGVKGSPQEMGEFAVVEIGWQVVDPFRHTSWYVRGISQTSVRFADMQLDADPLQNRRYMTLPLSSRKVAAG